MEGFDPDDPLPSNELPSYEEAVNGNGCQSSQSKHSPFDHRQPWIFPPANTNEDVDVDDVASDRAAVPSSDGDATGGLSNRFMEEFGDDPAQTSGLQNSPRIGAIGDDNIEFINTTAEDLVMQDDDGPVAEVRLDESDEIKMD